MKAVKGYEVIFEKAYGPKIPRSNIKGVHP